MLALLSVLLLSTASALQQTPEVALLSSVLEDAVEMVDEKINGLRSFIEDVHTQLHKAFNEEMRIYEEKNMDNTQALINLVGKEDCSNNLETDLESIGKTWIQRIQHCFNMTKEIIQIEDMAYKMYQDVFIVTPTLCDGINNASLCMNTQTSFSRVSCLYTSVVSYIARFSDLQKEVLKLVDSVHGQGKKVVDDFGACFGNAENLIRNLQLSHAKENCPPLANKLVSWELPK